MFKESTEKLTALSFSCKNRAISLLSGKYGILDRGLFQGLDKSEFLRLSVIYTLKHPPTKAQLYEMLSYTKNPDAFDAFCKQFKGGKK